MVFEHPDSHVYFPETTQRWGFSIRLGDNCCNIQKTLKSGLWVDTFLLCISLVFCRRIVLKSALGVAGTKTMQHEYTHATLCCMLSLAFMALYGCLISCTICVLLWINMDFLPLAPSVFFYGIIWISYQLCLWVSWYFALVIGFAYEVYPGSVSTGAACHAVH